MLIQNQLRFYAHSIVTESCTSIKLAFDRLVNRVSLSRRLELRCKTIQCLPSQVVCANEDALCVVCVEKLARLYRDW